MDQLCLGDQIPVSVIRTPKIDRLRKELDFQRDEEERLEERITEAQYDLDDAREAIERLEKEIEEREKGEERQFPLPPYGETLVPVYQGFWEGVVNA